MRERVQSRSKMLIAILAALLCALVLSLQCGGSFASFAYADEQSDLEAEAAKVKEDLDKSLAKAEEVAAEYKEAQKKRDAATAAMNEAHEKMEKCQKRIEALQETLGDRAVTMYRSGITSFVTIFFESDSFLDLINAWDLLNNMNEQDAASIMEIKELKKESLEAEKEYAAQEEELNAQLKIVAEKKEEFDKQVSEFQAKYDSLEAEIAELVSRAYQEEAAQEGGDDDGGDDIYRGSGGTSYSGVAAIAMQFIGNAYELGAEDPGRAFDCSGLVHYCYAQCGISVPRNSEALYAAAREVVPVSDAQPGDVLYMPGHVGISLGGSSAVEAEWEATGVCTTSGKAWVCALRF